MELNPYIIKSAAEKELRALRRTSYSNEGFSDREVSAIVQAITAAIKEYDRQRNQESNS